VFIAGLAVAAVAAGGAAAAVFVIPVQARLAPVAGTSSAGHFSGVLSQGADEHPVQAQAFPRVRSHWWLRWKVSFATLGRPARVTLRVVPRNGAPAIVHVLSARCSGSAGGTLTLSGSQAGRIARGDAVVTVRAGSARLRGAVGRPRLISRR
jgi:hypothetical protein